jgi:Zn-dependent peptidase ImmA (M78 family)
LNTVTINIDRIQHLLKLYRLKKDDFLSRVSKGLKNPYKEADVFKAEIKVSLLKKIDSVLGKGLNYYLDPKELSESKEESIFFRKDKFNADLNLSAKKIVNHFEEEKISLSVLSKLSDIKLERLLPIFSVQNNPEEVAIKIREHVYPEFNSLKKEFLKSLISKLAGKNILVFEFVETWNKKEKVNINGFYLSPNVIVLKRNQKSFSREIFTLIHELAHYLLNEEEIDEKINEDSSDYSSLSIIERWCNDFAYYFLAGEQDKVLTALEYADESNDYQHDAINSISRNTNLSTIALYTRLLINEKISLSNYSKVCAEIFAGIKAREEAEKRERERENQKAKDEGTQPGGAAAKPILSPLLINTMQSALIEGIINEAEFCRRLNIRADKIEKYL